MGVIGTVGLPGSGKGEFAAVAEELGIPVVVMGDVVRAETEARGLDPAEDHGAVATQLREEEGPDAIAARTLPRIRDHLADPRTDTVVVDGIRSAAEVERFEEAFGADFTLVSIEAPFEVRADRLGARGRDATDIDSQALRERDERERGFGMDAAMDRADITVSNTESLTAFRAQVTDLLQEATDP
ncbi:MAG: AAA family ATPase [Halobacteriaceae archaeon]